MVNQKLKEIGQKLNVTEKDIKEIGNAGLTNRILSWIVTPLIAILSFILGFFLGRGTCPPEGGVTTTTTTTILDTTTTIGGGYPYAAGLAIPIVLADKKRSSRIAVLLMSAIAFLIAIKACPVFGQVPTYSVVSRE